MAAPTEQIEGSILHDLKQLMGMEWDDNTFDLDLKLSANAIFLDLQQIGVGPKDGFEIEDHTTMWDAYLANDKNLNAVKSYMHLRLRLILDPPANGFLVTSLEKQIEKLEWRLQVKMDPVAEREVVDV